MDGVYTVYWSPSARAPHDTVSELLCDGSGDISSGGVTVGLHGTLGKSLKFYRDCADG
jgi:hypothetical protein